MLAHAADHLRPLIIFLVYTGARMSEALYVDWSDTDLEAGWVVFRGTKRNGEDRGVPLHKNVVNALNGLSPKTGKVFLTQRGKPYSWNEKRAGGQVKTAWRGMLRRAGVTGVTPHTLRHTFSTYLTAKGVSERIRDELMGHASTETGDIYAHVPRPDLIAAVGQLPHIRAEPVQAAAAKVQNTRKVRKLG